ncbi:MAG TPA: class I SAM-dependent methyltransferase, partial [Methylomirabilota bacterium]|nr:class I SAM-dependent methyltransferase [Methylomirabilota bacterium]
MTSRLAFHIRQKIAQRDSLDLAATWLGKTPGVIVEFGFGAGRSYSHLVARFPECEVFCFDRADKAHVLLRPPPGHLIVGEFTDVLGDPAIHARFAGRVILLHVDVGSGGPEDEVVPEFILSRVHGWLSPGAAVISDQHLTLDPAWNLVPVDTSGRVAHAELFHVYRRP